MTLDHAFFFKDSTHGLDDQHFGLLPCDLVDYGRRRIQRSRLCGSFRTKGDWENQVGGTPRPRPNRTAMGVPPPPAGNHAGGAVENSRMKRGGAGWPSRAKISLYEDVVFRRCPWSPAGLGIRRGPGFRGLGFDADNRRSCAAGHVDTI